MNKNLQSMAQISTTLHLDDQIQHLDDQRKISVFFPRKVY